MVEESIHPFYKANVHEARVAAALARSAPMVTFVLTVVVLAVGTFWYTPLLLYVTAALNVVVWIWISAMSVFGIIGSRLAQAKIDDEERKLIASPPGEPARARGADVCHVIVIPNYEEPVEILAQTLQSLVECRGSHNFRVVLAMEAREAEAAGKADQLKQNFGDKFASLLAAYHPKGLAEEHGPEVPGKASNLKWAVAKALEDCGSDGSWSVENAVLTVMDADCIFHPGTFAGISEEFATMRAAPGEQHLWTMWQAPQIAFRNYYASPVPSRVWGYISGVYEFGGVSALVSGGHHMVFSAYSVSMQLAVKAQLWDGDVIAEDHHAYLKCLFYSAYASASESSKKSQQRNLNGVFGPPLRVRQIMLPVKSTSVVSPHGYYQTWWDRWDQAKRHCQGVAELSYSLLAFWDMLRSLPFQAYSLHFVMFMIKALIRPYLIHVLPVCQALALAVLTLVWLVDGWKIDGCPPSLFFINAEGGNLLCGLAGAWVLAWPVVIPFLLLALSNLSILLAVFVRPGQRARESANEKVQKSIWYTEDGRIPPTCGSQSLTLIGLLTFDHIVMGPIMVVYGIFAELQAFWNVMLRGNQFKYITAMKAAGTAEGYGSV